RRLLFTQLLPLPLRVSLFPYTTLFRSARRSPPPPVRRSAFAQRSGRAGRHVAARRRRMDRGRRRAPRREPVRARRASSPRRVRRSEEHTSELQSRVDLVCRLLLEKKKN